jgi:hypothetical protein
MSFNIREETPKTADNFHRSPQHKNTHHYHSANISINFEPFKSPIILADESYKYQLTSSNSIKKSPLIVNGQISFK